MKELIDKEVIIIDKYEYVKVQNPDAIKESGKPKYIYIPVDEYLAKRESFITPSIQRVEGKNELPSQVSSLPPTGMVPPQKTESSPNFTNLKKKVLITYFDDRTQSPEERFGDWMAEKLIREVNQKSNKIIFIDYLMVKEFLEKKELPSRNLENFEILRLLNEVFGIHAIVSGEVSGPYVFITKGLKDSEETSSAVIRFDIRLKDTFSGKTLKTLSFTNPIFATKEKGGLSDEKAKGKAIDISISELSRSLIKELEGMDWFCRIAKVDGEEVYINAGKLTGIKVGDIMEVIHPERIEKKEEIKGRIQISAIFGIDASVGRVIQGTRPDEKDILKLAKREGI